MQGQPVAWGVPSLLQSCGPRYQPEDFEASGLSFFNSPSSYAYKIVWGVGGGGSGYRESSLVFVVVPYMFERSRHDQLSILQGSSFSKSPCPRWRHLSRARRLLRRVQLATSSTLSRCLGLQLQCSLSQCWYVAVAVAEAVARAEGIGRGRSTISGRDGYDYFCYELYRLSPVVQLVSVGSPNIYPC